MTQAAVSLPWPHRDLSPNARLHWGALARAKKRAKHLAHYTALEAGIGKIDARAVTVTVFFFPKDSRPRDIDNALASCKAYFDAIADVIGIDDSKWELQIAPKCESNHRGTVTIQLEWAK